MTWITDYLRLALRTNKALQKAGFSQFLDTYYGPPEIKALVQGEPDRPLPQLAEQALELMERLPGLDFDSQRMILLEKNLRAIRTLCNQYSDKRIDFVDLVRECLDIEPSWIPESEFRRFLELLDAGLPGKLDLRARFQAWYEKLQIPIAESELVIPLAQEILAEARRRTNLIVELPKEETVELLGLHGISYGAANWYQGGYHSRMELNLDRAVNLFSLVYQMCHEGYPGHHTEWSMKEKTLVHERGYQELSVFCLGPQLTIAEGIASTGLEMILTIQEVEAWMFERILPAAGLHTDGYDLAKIIEASRIISPDDLSSNLALMMNQGLPVNEIFDYAMAYTPYSDSQIRTFLTWLESPQAQVYAFSYSHGKRLIQPLLNQPDRNSIIRRLLTEPISPSGIPYLHRPIEQVHS